jgi:hypothetical protein
VDFEVHVGERAGGVGGDRGFEGCPAFEGAEAAAVPRSPLTASPLHRLHDVNLAAEYSHWLVALREDQLVARVNRARS